MSTLLAEARVALSDPDPVVAAMCEHFEDGGAVVQKEGQTYTVPLGAGLATLILDHEGLNITAEADDLVGIYQLRWVIAEHLVEYAEEASREVMPEFTWTGAGADLVTPPNCRMLEVASVHDVTPHIRRITFKAEDLERFDTQDDHHIRLLLPRSADTVPDWPYVGRDGILKTAKGERAPLPRVYTIRTLDRALGTVDIDFVLHEHSGPAASFARRAQAGDVIAMIGPLGGAIPLGLDWYLLACDEAGIPELARTLQSLPERARGIAYIEVAGPADEQEIVTSSGIEIRWLHRNSAEPGTTTLLTEAVRGTELPSDGSSVFVWAAGEFEMFRSLKAFLRDERGLRRDQHMVGNYWRRGRAGSETV